MSLFEIICTAIICFIIFFISMVFCLRYAIKTLNKRITNLKLQQKELNAVLKKFARSSIVERNEIKKKLSQIKKELEELNKKIKSVEVLVK